MALLTGMRVRVMPDHARRREGLLQQPRGGVLSSTSVHDSQASIPLAAMTAGRAVNFCDLTDTAKDAHAVYATSKRLGHVPIIDPLARRTRALEEALTHED